MKKTLCTLLASCIIATTLGVGTACNSPTPPPTTESTQTISASMLDGKVANLMDATGFGLLDQASNAKPASTFSAFANNFDTQSQKEFDFAKETNNGFKGIHFHELTGGVKKSYKLLNAQFEKHHHQEVECEVPNCDIISDEVLAQEESGQTSSVYSLGARANKLYSTDTFTFLSVSSAVEGEVDVLGQTYRPVVDTNTIMNLKNNSTFPTVINIENHYNQTNSSFVFNYINIPATQNSPAGIIPIKGSSNETDYHTANYWCDDYNQSYIIDNATGATYSLSQFKYIYSVKNGIIKVFDENQPGYFAYYIPTITTNGVEFVKKQMPSGVSIPVTSNSVLIDCYGNVVLNTKQTLSDADEYGEKKLSSNTIYAGANKQIFEAMFNHSNPYVKKAGQRYSTANRYHIGNDNKIYRVDFKESFSKIKIHVLDQNCTWQQVDQNAEVDFGKSSGWISYMCGDDMARRDFYRLTKISNGYAYVSTAAYADGQNIFDQTMISNERQEMFSDFSGVTKVPVNGATDNSPLEFMTMLYNKGVDVKKNFSTFLVGKTQMLYYKEGLVGLMDVKTGQVKEIMLDGIALTELAGDNLYFSGLGYINITEEVDFNSFGKNTFSNMYVKIGGELEEYYKLLTSTIL